mgnify:CR=1 FL=1
MLAKIFFYTYRRSYDKLTYLRNSTQQKNSQNFVKILRIFLFIFSNSRNSVKILRIDAIVREADVMFNAIELSLK